MAVNRFLVLATLAPAAWFAFGCGEDVGACQDRNAGQDTVLVNGSVQYGGQAIMNIACAQGCHSSDAKGAARNGAPAGLDFDLHPVDPEGEEVEGTSTSGDAGTVIKLKPSAASELRERQRKIFEDRNQIWQQVKDGLMPPDGAFARFRSAIKSIVDSSEATPCTGSKRALEAISEKSSQDVLRIWLACGAPIVEASSAAVQSYGAPGAAGYQFPLCEGGGGGDGGVPDGGGGGTAITIEAVHAKIFGMCTDCHSPEGEQEPDMSTPDKAYAVLVEDTAVKCGGKPYVTKGDPTKSFFYELVSQKPACASRMPPGGALNTSDLKLISDWIKGGALRAADAEKSLLPLRGGLDAGTR